MSRSYRRTPITGNTTAKSEKHEKRALNKKLRKLPLYMAQNPKKVESNWLWGKDGKAWNESSSNTRNDITKKATRICSLFD